MRDYKIAKMECAEIKELLSEYVDGISDAKTKALVDEHLLTCKGCEEELGSLKALVNELGSLESAEAPKDFLDKLHERIEARFQFGKLMRVLFVPMRIKIPLELASLAAMAILIFSVLPIQQQEIRMADVPEGSRQVTIAKKAVVDTIDSELTAEKYKTKSAFEETTAKQSERQRKPIELALLLEPEASVRAYAPSLAMESAPAPKTPITSPLGTRAAGQAAQKAEIKRDKFKIKKRAKESSIRPRLGSKDELAQSLSYLNEAFSKVKSLVGLVEGKVISVEYEKQTGRPQSILAAIPAKNYNSFYKSLKQVAALKTPPPAIAEKDQKALRIRIRFISSK